MERCGHGYEPFFFLFLSAALAAAALLLSLGESARTPLPDNNGSPADFIGASFLLLFTLIPADVSPLFTALSILTAAAALIRLPRLFRGCPPAAVLAGSAAAGIPGVLFQPAEPFILLLASAALLSLFPRKFRLPAAFLACLLLAVRMFLPVLPAEPEKGEMVFSGRTPDPETLRALHHLTLLACAEAGNVPQTFQCVTEDGGQISSPGRLSLAVLEENTGGQSPKQYIETDVLRYETLTNELKTPKKPDVSPSESSPGNVTDSPLRIFLFDPGHPANFRSNFRCTENFFQRVKESLPGDAIIGFFLPENAESWTASTLSALRNTFPHTAFFLFPRPMVLASSERPLTQDPEELDQRAVRGQVYEKLFSPYHILNLALPHFQDPVAVSSVLDAASRAKPNRTDRLIFFREPAPQRELLFSRAVRMCLPAAGAVLLLYLILRYLTGWKPERKCFFRGTEAGFLFAGSAFFLAVPFFRSVEPDPVKWFPVCISVTALGATWAFTYATGKRSTGPLPRVILPLTALGFLFYIAPYTVWGLFFAAMFMGAAWKNAFVIAAMPLAGQPAENAVSRCSAIVFGCAAALFLSPLLFFAQGGIGALALLLAAILATRRPAVPR